jgi:hypothetical protein
VIYSIEVPQRRAVLQVVGRRVDISIQEEWGLRVRRTQIVAIGAAGGINAGVLEETFASCISAPHPRRLKPTESVVEVVDSGTRNS